MTYRPTLRISQSKQSQYDSCALALKFRYIDKIPSPSTAYFEHGHNVEDLFVSIINHKKTVWHPPHWTLSDVELDAMALYNLKELQNDCLTNTFETQKTFKQCRCNDCWHRNNITEDEWEFWPCEKCKSMNYERRALIGVLDLYFPTWTRNRDLKTSASERTKENLQKIKWQAMMYKHFTWNDLWFAVANKKNHTAKVYPTKVSSLDALRLRCEELAIAFELWVFEPNPSFNCKFCAFSTVCDYSYAKK